MLGLLVGVLIFTTILILRNTESNKDTRVDVLQESASGRTIDTSTNKLLAESVNELSFNKNPEEKISGMTTLAYNYMYSGDKEQTMNILEALVNEAPISKVPFDVYSLGISLSKESNNDTRAKFFYDKAQLKINSEVDQKTRDSYAKDLEAIWQ